MDSRKGILRDELLIKAYILFVLKGFDRPLSIDILTDVIIDRVSNYFEFIAALSDLVGRGLVLHDESLYAITQNGRKTLASVESGIPASTRKHTTDDINRLLRQLERDEAVLAHSEGIHGGGVKTTLSLDTDAGRALQLELLLSSISTAREIEENFKQNAEKIYNKILNLLLEDGSETQSD
ncbi:MAG: DUF4364 family protein [Oscillospiraceae bacterium]|jgi:DNA-binding PadR family transcriptional regulator|nr:DUF4364 family protein [Oscillospiraceae bacterium]